MIWRVGMSLTVVVLQKEPFPASPSWASRPEGEGVVGRSLAASAASPPSSVTKGRRTKGQKETHVTPMPRVASSRHPHPFFRHTLQSRNWSRIPVRPWDENDVRDIHVTLSDSQYPTSSRGSCSLLSSLHISLLSILYRLFLLSVCLFFLEWFSFFPSSIFAIQIPPSKKERLSLGTFGMICRVFEGVESRL